MKRREMLAVSGAALLGLSALPARWVRGEDAKRPKILYFTRSAGFEHSVVHRDGDNLAFSEKVFTEMGKKNGFDVVCSKDGSLFDGDLDQYDALAFYATGDLTKPDALKTPPMTAEGKAKLLEAIKNGKPFIGFHAATDCFRSGGVDPYIEMIGGEFVSHGAQQVAPNKLVSPKFPGTEDIDGQFEMNEEWYAMRKFNPEMHVILVQETGDMKGDCYNRVPFPATWAKMYGKGRVFYTSLGHREDVWESEIFQKVVLGGLSWALGQVDADVTPNFEKVTPKANEE